MPYPGTPLHQYAEENNLFRVDPSDYERFDMTETVFKTPDMTSAEIVQMCQNVYRSFLTPRFVLRQITDTRSWEDLAIYSEEQKRL